MKVDIFMPFYIGDYLRDTMHLTTEQHGAYMLLLCTYWIRRGPLPDNDQFLASSAKLPAELWQSHKQTMQQFFTVANGMWRHKRVDSELEKAISLRNARSEAGKRGAFGKRKAKPVAEPPAEHVANTMAGLKQSPPHSHSLSLEVCVNDQPTELPPGFPKTVEEAKVHAAFIGCTEDFADITWHKAVGRGGRDAKDVPVRNWRGFLTTEWKYEQERREKQKCIPQRKSGRIPEPNQVHEDLQIPRL